MSRESGNWYGNQEKGRENADNEYQLHGERTTRMDPYKQPSHTSNPENTTPIALSKNITREEKLKLDGKEENHHVRSEGIDVTSCDEEITP